MYPYRRLLVWQKAHQFAVAVRANFARCAAPDIALASAQTTEYPLLRAGDTGHLAAGDQEELDARYTGIQKMLSGLLAVVRRGSTAGVATAPRRGPHPAGKKEG